MVSRMWGVSRFEIPTPKPTRFSSVPLVTSLFHPAPLRPVCFFYSFPFSLPAAMSFQVFSFSALISGYLPPFFRNTPTFLVSPPLLPPFPLLHRVILSKIDAGPLPHSRSLSPFFPFSSLGMAPQDVQLLFPLLLSLPHLFGHHRHLFPPLPSRPFSVSSIYRETLEDTPFFLFFVF